MTLLNSSASTTEETPLQAQLESEKRHSCDQLDMVVGNFYATPDRAMRVHLSPSWLKSTTSTIKYVDKKQEGREYTTLTQVSSSNETVCLKDGTFYAGAVKKKFPLIQNYIMCARVNTLE